MDTYQEYVSEMGREIDTRLQNWAEWGRGCQLIKLELQDQQASVGSVSAPASSELNQQTAEEFSNLSEDTREQSLTLISSPCPECKACCPC